MPRTPDPDAESKSHEDTNGFSGLASDNLMDAPVPASETNGTKEAAAPAQVDAPQPTSDAAAPPSKDAEGFSVPPPANDPISEAEREAAGEEADQLFKLNIHSKPVGDEDPEAKKAAMSSVANSLKLGPATRRSGTIRGRRDVRNTIYVPSPNAAGEAQADTTSPAMAAALPGSPSAPGGLLSSRPSAVAALASENSGTAASDTQSVRSGNSLGSLVHVRHPEMTRPGLHASIIETVSAVFESGAVKSAAVAGEIAFVNNPTESSMFQSTFSRRLFQAGRTAWIF
jgi:hypothetical protein